MLSIKLTNVALVEYYKKIINMMTINKCYRKGVTNDNNFFNGQVIAIIFLLQLIFKY